MVGCVPGMWRGYAAVIIFAVLFGCSSIEFETPPAPDQQRLDQLLSGELILGRHWQAQALPELDLFELTSDMKAFAENAVVGLPNRYQRAKALHEALVLPRHLGGRGLTYNIFITNTPQQAFDTGQVNCVSFTFLYVAMARHLGLDARVNEVDIPPSWDLREREAFLFLRHVNAKIRLGIDDNLVLDLEMDRYSPAFAQRLISEDQAAAQFYNNRGMELSAAREPEHAFLYLRKALLLDDQQSYIWSNMATLYRRQRLYLHAEAAYLQGLRLDPKDLTIISNLSGLYAAMGREQEAQAYFQRAERHRAGNPYYLFSLAREALESGQPEEALRLLQKPLRKHKREPRFFDLAAEVYRALGDEAEAQRMKERAERLRVTFLQ